MSLHEEVYEELSTLQWLLQKYKTDRLNKNDPFVDTTHGQGRVLAILKMQSDITTKDLAYILGIRQQSLNELLKKLEKNGYVERVPSKADGRVLLVRLTEKGKNLPDTSYDYSNIFKGFNEDELNEFSDYLQRIIASLEEELGDVFDENFYNWMENVRERMSEEQFEKMLSMRQGVFNRFGGWNMFNRENNSRGFGFMGGEKMPEEMPGAERFDPDYDGPMPEGRKFPFGFFDRGKAPEGMPGAERFSPDYDGPMPEGRKFPFGFASQKVKEEKSSDDNK